MESDERGRRARSAARILEAGLNAQYVRSMTHGPDNLLRPLTPSRECLLSDDPRAAIVREIFCGSEWHVRFVRGLLLFSDYLAGRRDAVMGASETTAVLLNAATPTEPVDRILDLGCGAGTLALLLRSHGTQVVATDINPRAVDFAKFNAAINHIEVDVRLGDLFEPVSGELFDLIVSQPPYYPGTTETFLHGGPLGCEIADRILAEVRNYLTNDGVAVIHTSLPVDRATPEGTVEYTPGIGEVDGTRHSLLVVGKRPTKTRRIDVEPNRWGQKPLHSEKESL